MCGIVGFFEENGSDRSLKLETMSRRIQNRGPDDFGRWICPQSGMAFAHRRLSILDLSPRGHQPMHSASGRYVTVFNGEIYNFKRLQTELEQLGAEFKGGSDTEILLAAVELWGVRTAAQKFIGMFAFAIWDNQEQKLHLLRDRAGKKPLYYGWNRDVFYFASELKALWGHPRFSGEINRRALALMLRYGYVPAPLSIYQGIGKLPPGSHLELDIRQLLQAQGAPLPQQYWDAEAGCIAAQDTGTRMSEGQGLKQLDELLQDAVSIRMLADVPLGAFLSGGIDSSLVVAMMQRISSTPVRTFSIGFQEKRYDEAPFAARVARHLGSEHTEIYLTAADALAVIPRMSSVFDEPFGDQSQIPTFLVSQLARRSVTVALSGDGGDELFAGYPRYRKTDQLWKTIRLFPPFLRAAAGRGVRTVPESVWKAFFALMSRVAPGYFSEKDVAAKVDRISHVLALTNFEQLYQRVVSFHEHDMTLVKNTPPIALDEVLRFHSSHSKLSRIERMMLIDLVSYLPDDILVKVDRCSMAVSLEARAPLLDQRIVEFSWRVPLALKQRNGVSKFLLRQLLAQMVPRELFERPKMGFGIPYSEWMRNDLRNWCDDLLTPQALESHGLLDVRMVNDLWRGFKAGRDTYAGLLWNLVLFQDWYRQRD